MTAASWEPVLTAMQQGRYGAAIADLDGRLAARPLDVDSLILRAVAKSAAGRIDDAERDLWRALAIDPDSKGARATLGDLFVRDLAPAPRERQLGRDDGKRPAAGAPPALRDDQRTRYAFAARWLRDALAPAHHKTGADVFCGDGGGTRMVADLSGSRVVGIDGSAEAIARAERAHGGHRLVFRRAAFPFAFAPRTLDFAVCFGAIELVADCDGLLVAVDAAVRGPMLLSFPLRAGWPPAAEADGPGLHRRQFTVEQMVGKLARLCARRVTMVLGQKIHRLERGRVAGHLPAQQTTLTALRPDSQIAVVVTERE